jgi:RNA polymerase sigma-70 factor (ECF subfamily)
MTTGMALTTEAVWTEFHANLLRFVSRRVRNPADAEDVVQRVFLQVHRALPTLRDADRLPAWLFQMTRRAIIDYYRVPAHRREQLMGDATEIASENDVDTATTDGNPDEPTALAELATCLRPLMSGLTDMDQQALTLVEFEGVSQVEAARRLGVSVSGMKSRVQRARTRLRKAVETCCRVELDRRGGLTSYDPRDCDSCGCGK